MPEKGNSRRSFLKKAGASVLGSAAIASTAQAQSYDKTAVMQYGSDYQHHVNDYQLRVFANEASDGTEVDSYNESGTYEDDVYYENSTLRMEGWIKSGGHKDKYEYNGSFRRYHITESTDLRIQDGDPDTTRSWILRVEGDGRYTVHFYSDYQPSKANLANSGDEVGMAGSTPYVSGRVIDGGADTFRVYGDVKNVLPSNVGNYLRFELISGDYNTG